MARRKKGGSKKAESQPAQDAPTEDAPASETPAEAESSPAEDALDAEASNRLVAACASIASAASIAVAELQRHAGPFLTFSQKTNISALATNFETGFAIGPVAPPALTGQVVEGGLSRAQVEEIVSSAVQSAVKQALFKIGATADEPIRDQVARQVDTQIAAQEHRLLDYVKKQLLDSLQMLEDSLDDRIVEYLEGHEEQREAELEQERTRAEVDKQVEEAKDSLLQSIDEVRNVELGFDISEFAAGLAEVVGADGSIDGGEVVEVGGEEDADLEIELGDGDLEVEFGDDGVEVEAGDDDLEIEFSEDVLEIEGGDGELEIEIAEEEEEGVEIELGDADPGAETVERSSDRANGTITESVEPITLDLDVAGTEDAVEIELGSGDEDEDDVEDDVELEFGEDVEFEATTISPPPADEVEAGETDLMIEAEDEGVEELSVIEEAPDGLGIEVDGGLDSDEGDLIELDLGELDEDDDNPALLTLGTGPDDIDSLSFAEISADYEIEAIEDDPGEEEEDGDVTRTIEHYLKRAAEMRARKQSAAAMELYSKVLDLDTDNYEARVGRGVVHLEAKDYKRSVEEFNRADRIDPSKPAGSLGLAEVHFHRKQFNKAIRHYTRCLKLDDRLAQAYCNRGLSYYYQKNYKKAFLDLMKAYDLDSELPNIKKYLKLVRNKVKSDK
jgi:tetratricopeptide (TPR) repeat protein